MIDAALELASLGWPIFPCIETPGDDSKRPYTKNGFHDASTEPELIRKWWNYRPNALIGIAIPQHLLVIDIDPRNGGSWRALNELAGPLPNTLTCYSGRNDGGQHLWYFRPDDNLTLTKTRLPPGIDLKEGGRGYVIAPPSLHPDSGQPYREHWEDWEHGSVACVPWKLYELLKLDLSHRGRFLSSPESGDFSGLLAWVAASPDGCRNDHTFFAACRLAEKNALDAHEDELTQAAMSAGLGMREVQTCIESARRRIKA